MSDSSTHEKFHNWSAGIHYIILIFAIISGGWWGVFTFNALHQAEKAEKELIKAERELVKIEKELTEIQSRINNTQSTTIKINTVQLKNRPGIIIEVKIKNNGKEKLTFNLLTSSLKVYKVKSHGDHIGAEEYYSPKFYSSLAKVGTKETNKYLPEQILLINAEKTLSYLVTLDKKGIYYITFSADYAENKNTQKKIKWFASKFIELK